MHMEVMLTKTPAMIHKELLMHAIAYNAIRALILEGASVQTLPQVQRNPPSRTLPRCCLTECHSCLVACSESRDLGIWVEHPGSFGVPGCFLSFLNLLNRMSHVRDDRLRFSGE